MQIAAGRSGAFLNDIKQKKRLKQLIIIVVYDNSCYMYMEDKVNEF